jgi:acyl carrier protein
MSPSRDEVVKDLIAAYMRKVAAAPIPDPLPDDFDMRREGMLDSLSFIQMIVELEENIGSQIDFDDLSPDVLFVVGPLSRHVANTSRTLPGESPKAPNDGRVL